MRVSIFHFSFIVNGEIKQCEGKMDISIHLIKT